MEALAIQFDSPWWLVALLAAAIPLWLNRRIGRWRGVGQACALALAIAALAQPSWRSGGGASSETALFLDVSASQGQLAEGLDLPFAIGRRSRTYAFADGVGDVGDTPARAATLLGPILSLLDTAPAPPAAAVIVTDGRFTDTALDAGLLARIADGPTTLLWVARAPAPGDARITDLAGSADADGNVRLAITVVADGACRQVLRVTRADRAEPLTVRTLDLSGGSPITVRLRDTLGDGPGLYAADLSEPDLLAANNHMVLPIRRAEQTLLWVAPTDALAPTPPPRWRVRRVAPAQMPATSGELLGYAAIVVIDTNGLGLSPQQRAATAEYLRLGGGGVLIGSGPYGSIDDLADPINRVAPLVVSPLAQRPLDVTVLLDGSASMAEPARSDAHARKFDLAAQAVMAMARRQLGAGDQLRVITFTGKAIERFDEPVTDANLDALAGILAKVRPVGGTRVAPALRMAWEASVLGERDRLVVVLSDLQTEAFDPGRWATRFTESGISLAVTAIGAPDPTAPLAQLAAAAAGRFELQADLTGIADVFIRTLQDVRGDPLIRRPEVVALRPPLDAAMKALPPIDTHLAATAHGDAEVMAATASGDPLLARRRVGAGRVVGLVAPLEPPYNAAWRADPAVAQLLAAAVTWTQMPGGEPGFDGTVVRRTDALELTITASDEHGPVNHLELVAHGATADAAEHIEAMRQVGPGRYTATVRVIADAPVVLTVQRTSDWGPVWVAPLAGRYPAEFAGTGVDHDALARLARQTGGYVVSGDRVAEHLEQLLGAQPTDLWPWLLAAAGVVMATEWLAETRLRR